MTARDPAAAIDAFLHEVDRRCSTRVEPTSFGTAYLNLDVPRRYDSNFVWVDRVPDRVEADALAADADRVLGELGLEHRRVSVGDDARGRELAPGFRELGWSVERLQVMAQVRPPDRRPLAPVRELGVDEAGPLLEEVIRRQPWATDEDLVRMMASFNRVLERELGARFFVADADGRPASICELYAIDGVAQVEDVNTLEEFRGRGLASAVVLTAADAARARGCELVFLVADEDDWPKELYARLGFDPVDRFWSFLSAPGLSADQRV